MLHVWTNYPIAEESPDHLYPFGTAQDTFTSPGLAAELVAVGAEEKWHPVIKLVDLGCSGGNWVQTCAEAGIDAVGLEGSDYSYKAARAAWGVISGRLSLCDISRPFTLLDYGRTGSAKAKVHIITAWDVMEHLLPAGIDNVFGILNEHLEKGGLFLGTIATVGSVGPHGIELHQTIRPEQWWLERLSNGGKYEPRPDLVSRFDKVWVREERGSFPFVYQRAK